MKSKIKYILISLLLISCNQKPSDGSSSIKSSDLNNLITSHHLKLNDYDKIIIIPGAGCGGCISEAEDFYLEHKNNTKSLFIFTGISDEKMFNIKIGNNIDKGGNAIVDINNFLIEKGFNSIYPSIAKVNGEYVDIEQFSK